MSRGMIRLEGDDSLEFANRVIGMAKSFVREADLEIERRDRGIDSLGFLQRLERLLGVAQVQLSDADDIKRGGGRAVQSKGFLGFLHGVVVLARKQESVGQI